VPDLAAKGDRAVALERAPQITRRGQTLTAIRSHRAVHELGEARRQVGAVLRNGCRLPGVDQDCQVREGLRFERANAGQALVQNHSQGIHVGARVEIAFASDLLGGHVVRRAQRRAFLRELQAPRAFGVELGDAEIQDLHERAPIRALGDEQIVRLQIAVHDAREVRRVHAGGRLPHEVHDLGDGHFSIGDARGERLAP